MKKHGIINSEISKVLSYMGHTDLICIGDVGLPIPKDVKRIDLAVKPGLPSFLSVLAVVEDDMHIEKVYLAKEIKSINPKIYDEILKLIPLEKVVFISHDELKSKTINCKAIIRTGEITPYANIILQSNVSFNTGG